MLLANQTVTLELTGTVFGATCIENEVINSLQGEMITYLNHYAADMVDMPCEFIPNSNRLCNNQNTVEMSIMLTCTENLQSNDLINSTTQQKFAIQQIMGRKANEIFRFHSANMSVRLFKNSEQRKELVPSCDEYCSLVKQGPVHLCNCTCKFKPDQDGFGQSHYNRTIENESSSVSQCVGMCLV